MRTVVRAQRVALALAAFVGAFPTAHGGINEVTALGPEGGWVNRIEFHPTDPSIGYMATEKGFLRTTDGGLSWQTTPSWAYLFDFAVDPSDADRVYVAAMNEFRLLVSEDAGATLTPVPTLPVTPYGPSAIEISRDGVIYVLRATRLFRSADHGVTWTEQTALDQPNSAPLMRVDPLDSDTLYAFAAEGGAVRSTDRGITWDPISAPVQITDVIVAATTPRLLFASTRSGVFVSSNQGDSWAPAGLTQSVSTIAIDPTNSQILYAGASHHAVGVFRSLNQGGSWSRIEKDPQSGELRTIAVSPAEPELLLAGGNGGIARSTDAGLSWVAANRGFIATSVDKFVPVIDSRRIYFNTYTTGIHALDVDTSVVTPVNLDNLANIRPIGRALESFDLIAQSVSGEDRLFVGMNGGFARSIDAGEQWQWVNTPGSGAVSRFSSPRSQPNVIVASAGPNLHRSVDGGTLWSGVNGLPPYAEASVIEFAPSNDAVAYAAIWTLPPPYTTTSPAGIYKSVNGGLDWAPASEGMPADYVSAIAIDPENDDVAYAGTADGMFKTLDGGDSWTPVVWHGGTSGIANVNDIALDPSRPNIVYATQYTHVGRSIDGGQIWENVETIVPGISTAVSLLVHPFKEHTVLAGVSAGGAVEVTLATDIEVEAPADTGPVPYGSSVSKTFVVRNLGPFHATELRTSIQLPASSRDVSVAATSGTCDIQGQVVTCTQPYMLAGRAAEITVQSNYPAAGNVEIVASASASETDDESSNDTARSAIQVREESNVSVTGSVQASIVRTENLSYSFVVSNSGPNMASATSATVRLPAGMSVVGVTTSRGTCDAGASGVVTCNVGDLEVDASATIGVTATAATAATYDATIDVASNGFDPVTTNNTAMLRSVVTDPAPPSGGGGSGGGGGGGGGGSGGSSGGGNSSGGGGGGAIEWWYLAILTGIHLMRRIPARRLYAA